MLKREENLRKNKFIINFYKWPLHKLILGIRISSSYRHNNGRTSNRILNSRQPTSNQGLNSKWPISSRCRATRGRWLAPSTHINKSSLICWTNKISNSNLWHRAMQCNQMLIISLGLLMFISTWSPISSSGSSLCNRRSFRLFKRSTIWKDHSRWWLLTISRPSGKLNAVLYN
jgi:hypothetical protein